MAYPDWPTLAERINKNERENFAFLSFCNLRSCPFGIAGCRTRMEYTDRGEPIDFHRCSLCSATEDALEASIYEVSVQEMKGWFHEGFDAR